MAQGIDNERYPAPIHLLLTQDDHFPRSIQLSIHELSSEKKDSLSPQPYIHELDSPDSARPKRRLFRESPEPSNKRPCLDRNSDSFQTEAESSNTRCPGVTEEPLIQNNSALSEIGSASNSDSAIFGGYSPDSLQLASTRGPRLLFAVRLEDNIRAEDLSPEYFADWLRMIPTIAREVKVEAGFECNSTLLLVSLPFSLRPYLPHHSAIISLGPVKSSNLLAATYLRRKLAVARRQASYPLEIDGDQGGAMSSGENMPEETNEAGDDTDNGSETESLVSLKSEIFKYPKENGRTYHAYKAGRYLFPNDEPETERLDLQHHLFYLTFDCNLYMSPIAQKNISRVLDVGTGTGLWAIDFADVNPGAEVVGMDLSPIQPNFVPPNVQFIVGDIEATRPFKAKFDFIYSRMMTASIRDWPQFFADSFENLAPGGYIELADICFPIQVIDKSLPSDSALRRWSDLMLEATQIAGSPINSAKRYKSQLEIAGFKNVVESKYVWPHNSWARGRKARELGMWSLTAMTDGLEGLSMALFTRILHWSKDEVTIFLAAVRQELRRKDIHAYWVIYVVYGQKPE